MLTHMQTVEPVSQSVDDGSSRIPPGVRFAILGGVAIVLAGALYLIAVRGEALLIDLSQLAGRVWCF